MEFDFAALAHTQGTGSKVTVTNRPSVEEKVCGNIHYIDGSAGPTIVPAVMQLVTDYTLVGGGTEGGVEVAVCPVTFKSIATVGFHTCVVGSCGGESGEVKAVRRGGHSNSVGEIGGGAVFHHPTVNLAVRIPAECRIVDSDFGSGEVGGCRT